MYGDSDYHFDSSTVMMMSGECMRELSTDEASYERALESDVVGRLNAILEVCLCCVVCEHDSRCLCLCVRMFVFMCVLSVCLCDSVLPTH